MTARPISSSSASASTRRMPGARSLVTGRRAGDLVADLDGELLLLLGQRHPHRRLHAVALVQADGTGAGLADGESHLVENGLVHPGPARHRCRHQSGGPDVLGLRAEAEFNGGHASPSDYGRAIRGPGRRRPVPLSYFVRSGPP